PSRWERPPSRESQVYRQTHPDWAHPDWAHPDWVHPDWAHPDWAHPDLSPGDDHASAATDTNRGSGNARRSSTPEGRVRECESDAEWRQLNRPLGRVSDRLQFGLAYASAGPFATMWGSTFLSPALSSSLRTKTGKKLTI